ncbi:MAG: NAD(P)-dependent oxidoreductase [Bacteroidales bacterium]|nr:NAD(P)-dependent oxidoreductase [Bacteroidales bacterium]
MKSILITGAGGFIGSFLVEEALNRGFVVWAGVRASSNLQYLQDKRIQFIDLSFQDTDILKSELLSFKTEFGGWDYIVHNLGATKVNTPSEFDRINFQYTRNFVNALLDCNMVPEQFIYMSSLSVCGPFDELGKSAIKTDDIPHPNTAYGYSKRKAEMFLESMPNFPYVILRPTGVYGPREKDYFMMIKTIKSGFDFAVGFKPQYLTFIYVKDLARVAFLAIEHKVKQRTYFISDGNTYLAKDFRQLTKQFLYKKFVLSIKLPLWLIQIVSILIERFSQIRGKSSTLNRDKYRIMKQRNWICDITPLKEELHFEAKFNLSKGLEESIHWYKQNNWI